MEQNEKNKTSFPSVHKSQKQKQVKCPVIHYEFWLPVSAHNSAWYCETTVFIIWSTRDTHIPGRVSKNCLSLSCLSYWGLVGFLCHYEDLRREVGLALSFHHHGLTIHPWGTRHRLPGSALTVTPWLSHLVSPVSEVNIYIMWLWEYGAYSPYLPWLISDAQNSIIRAFLLPLKIMVTMQMLSDRKKDGVWKELTYEALLIAKTCLEPVRIYICYIFHSHPSFR